MIMGRRINLNCSGHFVGDFPTKAPVFLEVTTKRLTNFMPWEATFPSVFTGSSHLVNG